MSEEKNPIDAAQKWLAELRLAKKEDERWLKRGKKIVNRYRDDRSLASANLQKKYNVLWANIQTMLPALYGKTPRAQVERRWKDQDPVGRTASVILERVLQYEIDHYGDFDASIKGAVLDRLLPGRGTVWVRFEEKETALVGADPEMEGEEPETPVPEVAEPIEYECTPTDYVFWEDFRCSPARNWDEVTWVARRVYMSRKEGVERFGEDFNDVPLTHEPVGLDEMKQGGTDQTTLDGMKKAPVWEIWCKTDKHVYWVVEGYSKALDIKSDPYGLDEFWPCPRPLYATQTTDTLVPVPDYALYQDQAEELDKLTNRIGMLVDAVKVVGVYDASQTGIQRMMNEGVNNTLIPVDSWAAFAEKGGIQGTVQFMPLADVLAALNQCYASRQQTLQVIYEITGLSDIIRGASVASETATAQQIKSQYASLRLRRMQMDVAQFASEVLRIKAQLIADLYSPESLIQMSGIQGTDDGKNPELLQAAIQLIKSEPARGFRIEVASDSLVEMDEASEKASRMEFLQAAGGFLNQALPIVTQAPDLGPLVAEMLLFGVRAFRGGRPMEAAFDDAMAKLTAPKPPKEPQPDPEQIKAQATMQLEQMRMQESQAKMQIDVQYKQAELQNAQLIEGERIRAQQAEAAMRMQHEKELEAMRLQAESERAAMEAQQKDRAAEMEASVKILIAQMSKQEMPEHEMPDMVGMHAEMLQGLTGVIEALKAPRKRLLERGEDGRAIGIVEIAGG